MSFCIKIQQILLIQIEMNVFTRLSYSHTPPMFAYYVSNAKHTHAQSNTIKFAHTINILRSAHISKPNMQLYALQILYAQRGSSDGDGIKKTLCVRTPSVQRYLFGCSTSRNIYIYWKLRDPLAMFARFSKTHFIRVVWRYCWRCCCWCTATCNTFQDEFHSRVSYEFRRAGLCVSGAEYFIIHGHEQTRALAHRGVRAEYFSYTGTHVLFIICRSVSDGDDERRRPGAYVPVSHQMYEHV